ncbi:MAG: hypothetical protein AAFW89_08065 [Bacteroidota bacterium]
MNFFRHHITRFYGTLILSAGLLALFGRSISEDVTTTSFSMWFIHHFQHDGISDAELETRLKALQTTDMDFQSVVQVAAAMVSSHEDVPESESDPDPVHETLVAQWNAHQQSGGMGSAIQIEPSKPVVLSSNYGLHIYSKHHEASSYNYAYEGILTGSQVTSVTSHQQIPFKNGMAISAP